MLRSALIFLAIILLPSLVLAWLAMQSARDQQVLLEHQQAIISQDVTDSVAKNIRSQIDGVRSDFVQVTQSLLSRDASSPTTAFGFDRELMDQWNLAEVGFAVDLHGKIYSPSALDGQAARTFREENERFLTNRENVEVYSSLNSQEVVVKKQQPLPQMNNPVLSGGSMMNKSGPQLTNQVTVPVASYAQAELMSENSGATGGALAAPVTQSKQTAEDRGKSEEASVDQLSSSLLEKAVHRSVQPASVVTNADGIVESQARRTEHASSAATVSVIPSTSPPQTELMARLDVPQKISEKISQVARQVSPQNSFNMAATSLSNTVPEESDFRRLIGNDTSGVLARFLDNKLCLMVWYRPAEKDDLVFGAQLNQSQLLEKLRSVLKSPEFREKESSLMPARHSEGYCLALLDDTGHPVALSITNFTTDWKRPFVATEIGETLPHWEAALYFVDPQQMSKSAQTLQLTISLIVLLLIVAIAAGGSLIAVDVRRQIRLAQQKTDFVSSVSHELKTPLTSIRMFADMLAEGRITEPERQMTYLKIISAESARLTRLINNVLDFARQERGAPDGERRPCDLVETTQEVVETCLPHLEANGQNLSCEIETESLPILGDRDALAQIVLNLLSNAEKYGGGEILVRVRRQEAATRVLGCVDVFDRGTGVPPKHVESIFLPFHRLHDSLSNGIPGSGLGLTLARRMARVHGGDITYTPRAGGGSCFTLAIPLSAFA